MKDSQRRAMWAKKSKYKVVAYKPYTNKRFPTMHYNDDMTAMNINMWRGKVYQLQSNGKYKVVKTAWN
jgi:hypothetical protein